MSARYEIYRNLRTGGFSLRHRGKVIERAAAFHVERPYFRVSAAGRSRVLRERRKNVHAYVCSDERPEALDVDGPFDAGLLSFVLDEGPQEFGTASYDPYKAGFFVLEGTESLTGTEQPWSLALDRAEEAFVYSGGIRVRGPKLTSAEPSRLRSTKEHRRVEWSHNGERSREESCWYWTCLCGEAEAAATKKDAQREWIWHLEAAARRELTSSTG